MRPNISNFSNGGQKQQNQQYSQNNFKKTATKAICLNPNCSSARLIDDLSNNAHQPFHQNCKGWIHGVDSLRNGLNSQKYRVLSSMQSFDYLQNPIESIFQAQKFSLIGWENHLFSYFQQIYKFIEGQLNNIWIKSQQEINNHLKLNNEIYTKIQTLCEDIKQNWQESHEKIYDKYLKSDLTEISMKGCIKISNSQLLGKKVEQIIAQIKQVGQSIWNQQLKYELNQRKIIKSKKQEIRNYGNLSLPEILCKIQELENSCKQKIKLLQIKDYTQALCFKCPNTVRSSAFSAKLRKQQCRKMILTHLCTEHTDEIAVKMVKNLPVKLTIQDLKKEIALKNIKKVMVIDKENSHVNIVQAYSDVYCIEVLSKNNQHIAKNKYLIAESTGKDAADILIVIVLYELSKLQLQQISLLTNDHYGQTLQPIFQNLGANIKLITSNKRPISIE